MFVVQDIVQQTVKVDVIKFKPLSKRLQRKRLEKNLEKFPFIHLLHETRAKLLCSLSEISSGYIMEK